MARTIPLTGEGGVLALMSKPGAVFSIKFRKVDGGISQKIGCMLAPSGNGLNEHKKRNRSGIVNLFQPAKNHKFECYMDIMVEFNGMTIFHPY
jgi:hypothetical protein